MYVNYVRVCAVSVMHSTFNYDLVFNFHNLKWVFAKNEKIATNLTSICCVYKEKIIKKTYNEECSVHTNSESCNIELGS